MGITEKLVPYLKYSKKKNLRTRIAGPPRPVREENRVRAHRKKMEHLAFLVVALLIGLAILLLLPH